MKNLFWGQRMGSDLQLTSDSRRLCQRWRRSAWLGFSACVWCGNALCKTWEPPAVIRNQQLFQQVQPLAGVLKTYVTHTFVAVSWAFDILNLKLGRSGTGLAWACLESRALCSWLHCCDKRIRRWSCAQESLIHYGGSDWNGIILF